MNKDLEALHTIGGLEAFTGVCEEEKTSMINELPEYKIIEIALKDYEETYNQIYDLFEKFGVNNRKDLLEKLKALETIKEYFDLISEYGKISFELKKVIPEDKYDLLKKVLL